MNDIFIWIGIAFCISQSAIFSGLNLAFFSLTRLRLEIEAEASPKSGALKVIKMRQDSNFLLTTILWGNVGINVLLTLLSNSVMVGMISFTFSTVIITVFGEIIPQAYFSRNALRMASILAPVLRVYQILLFPVAKPSALLLDAWLGKESVQYFAENNIKLFIKKHIDESTSEIDHLEGTGAINFFSLDDQIAVKEGEAINPESIIKLSSTKKGVIFPDYKNTTDDDFIQKINLSGEKWVIFTDEVGKPRLVLDSDGFIRSELFNKEGEGIDFYCHIPLLVTNSTSNLGEIIIRLKEKSEVNSDLPIDQDVVLIWLDDQKKIITGADIFGRLLKGI
ncbi:MAG: DUF21 domain-containing protein [Bacteroidales bacterium]|jgi:metal transporter CNNM|nr:DUF21 domain-containing protein [Bacteroidales bacterium]